MAVVKVSSYSRGGTKVKSHKRGRASSSSGIGDCSKEGIKKKYKEVSKVMDMPKSKISTGNKMLDYVLKSKLTKKVPYVGQVISAYKIGPKIGTGVARAKAVYDETCKKRK